MTDIVNRLRARADKFRGERTARYLIGLLRAAADEIERLRESRSLPIAGRVLEDGRVVLKPEVKES